ncbi:MAG: hypothetical protein ABI867_04185 [Kofleriaceae bacterium]
MSEEKWDQRQLCSDGSCIGVIGPDGTCKTCGRAAPNWGEERKRGLVEEADPEAAPDDDGGGGDGTEEAEAEAEVAAGADPQQAAAVVALKPRGVWNQRRLCTDGSCIGVLGPDGVCKLCGKAGAPVDTAGDEHDDDFGDDDPDDAELAGDDDDEDDDYDDEQDDELVGEDDPATPVVAAPALPPSAVEAPPVVVAAVVEEDPEKPRALCPDGACVGVIGSDGKCNLCGKAAA